MGAACRGDLAAAFLSSPASVDFALPLPFCFLAWVTGVFDFAAGDGFWWPSTAISPLAECALPLPFCFFAWSRGSSISPLATASAGRRLRPRRWRTVLCLCHFVSWLGSPGSLISLLATGLLAVDCDLTAGGLCFAFAVLFLGLGHGDLRFRCWRRLLLAVDCGSRRPGVSGTPCAPSGSPSFVHGLALFHLL